MELQVDRGAVGEDEECCSVIDFRGLILLCYCCCKSDNVTGQVRRPVTNTPGLCFRNLKGDS